MFEILIVLTLYFAVEYLDRVDEYDVTFSFVPISVNMPYEICHYNIEYYVFYKAQTVVIFSLICIYMY
jgi:hypothetical protein